MLPFVALPTTSGTGSEVTTVAVVDFPRLGTKTGVSHQHLRPALAIVDPALTLSCPPGVTASVGVDALLHALEAYTVVPYDARPALPLAERPPYQGANPFSDPLCERAIELVGRNLRAAVSDGDDIEARTAMALASTLAGMAFSGAGVHVPHALAYPIASLKHEWQPPGYGGAALVPHGFAVAVTAPAVFRFIEDADPGAVREGGPAARRRRRPRGVARAPARGRRRADEPARARVRRGRPRRDRPRRARPAPAARRLAEGGRRGRARGAAEGVAVSWPARVAIVGAGTMGVGISHVFASNGIPTVLVDSTAELAEAARERSLELLSRLEAAGNVGEGATATARANLTAAASVGEGVDGADLIVEAVVERPDVKAAVYAAIEAAAADGAVIATNTSSIPIAELAAGLRRPARFLGMHWFVPPLLVPCVEVIPAAVDGRRRSCSRSSER